MSSLPPPPPAAKDNDDIAVAVAAPAQEVEDSNLKRSRSKDDDDDDVAAVAADDRPHKLARSSRSESGTGPNAIPMTFENKSSSNTGHDGDGAPPPPPPPHEEQQEQQDQQQQQQDPQDATDTATQASSSITYYVLRDGGGGGGEGENAMISTTAAAAAAHDGQEGVVAVEQSSRPEAEAATAQQAQALPANTVVRMKIDGKTLDLRVGDVVLLSGGGGEEEEDISLADENAPPRDHTPAAAAGAGGAPTPTEASLWTARIEGFTGTTTTTTTTARGLDNNHVHHDESDEISFTARWFLTRQDIESLPAGIPWVGPVSREALCSSPKNNSGGTTAATEMVLSSKIDDNDIACIRGRATMKYNPTNDDDLANLLQQQQQENERATVYFCRYHLDVSDVNFSSYRLSHYDAQLHGPGTAAAAAAAAAATTMDTFTLDNTMGPLSAQERQQQQRQQQQQQQQAQKQQQQQQQQQQQNDDDDDDSSDSDNDDSTDGGERRVVVEGEGSQLRESIAVGIMHQAVVGPYIPGQLRARSRNPTLVWKASRHHYSNNTNNTKEDDDNNNGKEAAEAAATQKFQDFLQRLAQIHTPFLTKHRLTTTDPYSPLPAHKAEALQCRRKQPVLTGSFLSTSSMLNANNNNNNTSSSTATIVTAAVKDGKSHDVVVKEQGKEEEKATEIATSTTTATEKDVAPTTAEKDNTAPTDGEQDTDRGDDAKPKSAAAATATAQEQHVVVDMEVDNTAETKKDSGDDRDKVEPMAVDEKEDDDKKVEAKKKDGDGNDDKVQDAKMEEEKQDKNDDDKVLDVDDTKKKDEAASGPILECDLRKECCAEAILELWTATGENVEAAIQAVEKDLESGEGRFTTGWTMDEKKIFDDGFRETQGELRLIAKRLAPRKTLKDVVDYHYRFKVPDQFRKYQDKKRELALRMMDCIEKRRFHDPTAGTDDLNNNAGGGGTFSRRGSTVGGDKQQQQQQGWEDTTAADVTGATEERRQKARDLLLDVQSKLGNEIMAEVMNAVRKLNRSYDGETRNSLFHLLRGHQELQKRFSEFLPRHF